jgi:hypothetical protein
MPGRPWRRTHQLTTQLLTSTTLDEPNPIVPCVKYR